MHVTNQETWVDQIFNSCSLKSLLIWPKFPPKFAILYWHHPKNIIPRETITLLMTCSILFSIWGEQVHPYKFNLSPHNLHFLSWSRDILDVPTSHLTFCHMMCASLVPADLLLQDSCCYLMTPFPALCSCLLQLVFLYTSISL